MTVTLVKPNAEHGTGATEVAKVVRDRKARTTCKGRPAKNEAAPASSEFASAYEKSRVEELTARAAIYKLKLRWMQGELLDRRLVVRELMESFTAIREGILGSKLSQREKTDLLHNLAEIPVELVPEEKDADSAPLSDHEANAAT